MSMNKKLTRDIGPSKRQENCFLQLELSGKYILHASPRRIHLHAPRLESAIPDNQRLLRPYRVLDLLPGPGTCIQQTGHLQHRLCLRGQPE